jgi:hypothetical protein
LPVNEKAVYFTAQSRIQPSEPIGSLTGNTMDRLRLTVTGNASVQRLQESNCAGPLQLASKRFVGSFEYNQAYWGEF